MKRLMMLLVCFAMILPSVGCCLHHGLGCGAGYGQCPPACPGGACGPYGYSPQYQGAYYGTTTTTAGLAPYSTYSSPYAFAQPYSTMAAINPLPTY